MTDLDLDELERQLKWLEGSPPGDTRQASLRRVEKQKRLLWENRTALLAAARRLAELEGALEWIKNESLASSLAEAMWPSDGHDGMPASVNVFELAKSLGWKGTP